MVSEGSSYMYRDHFVYAPSQWETTLQCNVASHWLDAHTKWSLHVSEWPKRFGVAILPCFRIKIFIIWEIFPSYMCLYFLINKKAICTKQNFSQQLTFGVRPWTSPGEIRRIDFLGIRPKRSARHGSTSTANVFRSCWRKYGRHHRCLSYNIINQHGEYY